MPAHLQRNKVTLTAALLLAGLWPAPAATRLKELVSIEGVRENPLIGYGLVVGLNGTGDRKQTLFSAQSLANLLQRMGLTVSPASMQVRNTAAVMVTASLPPFAQPGGRMDVIVAAIGDASSLQGGLLLLTSLRGIDGRAYSVAQGPLVLGGYTAGSGGTSRTLNHPTTARVPNGAIVEQPSPAAALGGPLHLQLRQADFTTAARICEALNRRFGQVARAEHSAMVSVGIPAEFGSQVSEFLAEIETLTVEPDRRARVVVNERTGTVVMGQNVRIAPVTIMHGGLTVEIQTVFDVSQPAPFSQGTTQVVPQTTVRANEEKARSVVLPKGSSVEELMRGLTAIGATTRDVIAILDALCKAGALDADLEVI